MPPRSSVLAGALLAAVLLAGPACSGDDDGGPPGEASGTVVERVDGPEVNVVRAEQVSTAARRTSLDPAVRDQVARVLTRYLQLAVVTPMRLGRTEPGINGLMTPDAAERTGAADRAAMVDEGLPRAARVRPAKVDVGLTGLASEVGTELVVARIDWDLHGLDRQGAVRSRVIRTGELTLVPYQDRWAIAGYEVAVTRHVNDTTTTTEASG